MQEETRTRADVKTKGKWPKSKWTFERKNASGKPASGKPASGTEASRPLPGPLAQLPQTAENQNKLADELVAWAKGDEAFSLDQFCIEKNISPYKLVEIGDHNVYFADALDVAMSAISFKREKEARQRREDASIFLKMLPLYSKRYKKYQDEQQAKQMQVQGQQQIVVIEKFPEGENGSV